MSVKSISHNVFSLNVVFSTNLTLTLNEEYIIIIVSVWTHVFGFSEKVQQLKCFWKWLWTLEHATCVDKFIGGGCCFDEILEMSFLYYMIFLSCFWSVYFWEGGTDPTLLYFLLCQRFVGNILNQTIRTLRTTTQLEVVTRIIQLLQKIFWFGIKN